MGELKDVLAPALSSTNRAKSHWRGKPPKSKSPAVDAIACKEVRLLVACLACQVMHITRRAMEDLRQPNTLELLHRVYERTKKFEAMMVTFCASDKPLSGDELTQNGLVQFPTVMGGIVPMVNIEGIKRGEIVFDGPTLAKIFAGEITKWDDTAIKTLNPDNTLPDAAILIVHRFDGSRTTFNFTYYLADVSPDWKDQIGVDASVEWPAGNGAKGNEDVSATVGQTPNSIGDVEYAYAIQNEMTYANMTNKAGKMVTPKAENFEAAAEGLDWSSQPGFGVILANQGGYHSCPALRFLSRSRTNSPRHRAVFTHRYWLRLA